MGLPAPISQKAYDDISHKILVASSEVATLSMKKAADEELALSDGDNFTVSGDGSWKTRGHSSLVGVCTLIGAESGKVIDLEVMSSFCKGCDSNKKAKKGPGFINWMNAHKKHCTKNHTGSAGKMEVDGMIRIFQRSEEERGVQYKYYIGDGDTKTFTKLSNAQPYGCKTVVEKVECVGHVQKRMGTRLRKLKAQMAGQKLPDGKTIGGKGRLTDANILKITNYYGNAIRENKNNFYEMRKSIWAIWMHIVSTDEDPQHFFCPKGPTTWCKYNCAMQTNNLANFKHKNYIPKVVMDTIKPIFKDLAAPDLLKRCLGGRTQNANESLNSLIWKYSPKTINAGRGIVEIAANIACITFNEGSQGLKKIMTALDIRFNDNTIKVMRETDKNRVRMADLRAKEATHDARKARKKQKIMELEKQQAVEGTMYAAGAF